jgi:hypothetical protein
MGLTCISFASFASRGRQLSLSCSEARSPPLLGPSTAERSRHSQVKVTFGTTLLVAVGFSWAVLLFLLELLLGMPAPLAGLLGGSEPASARPLGRGEVPPPWQPWGLVGVGEAEGV